MFNYYKKYFRARWRNLDWVWKWNTKRARKFYLENYKESGFKSISAALHDRGICIAVDEIPFNLKELINYQQSIKQRFVNQLKPFLIEHWPTDGVLDFNNPFVKLAISEPILNIVSDYLGCWPRFYDYRLWETKIMTNEAPVYSQSWHRDPEDKKLINLFIYLNDVEDEGTGPFQYIPESHIEGKYWNTCKQALPPIASYPSGKQFESLRNKIETCYGPAGTVIFADTAGLHRGGYSTTKPRLMFKALFLTDGNFTNHKTRYKLPKELPELTKQQKYAIGL